MVFLSPEKSAWPTVTVLVVGAVMTGLVHTAAVIPAVTVVPRVRSSHAYIRAMIEEAAQRSMTFRHLVDSIEATNGIVYVEQGTCGHGVRACLTLSITPAAEYRILRVMVDARQRDWDVMASIAHELQHALEVLSNPTLTSVDAIYHFYSREGMPMSDSFETVAAIKVGDAVGKEVASYARRRDGASP